MILADQILAAIERNPDMGMLDVAEAVGHHIGEVRPILETLVDRHMILADYYGDPVERRYRRLPAKPKGLRWKGWKGLRYTVTNTAGERLGTVTATDEGDAMRKAALKWGAAGLQVKA